MTDAQIQSFARFVETTDLSYNYEAKVRFHREGKKVLAAFAEILLGPDAKGTYEIRSNQGGIAVSGEVTLHSDDIYVQLSQSCLGKDWGFMWRTCSHRKDYTGHQNQWAKWSELTNLWDLAYKMRQAIDRKPIR